MCTMLSMHSGNAVPQEAYTIFDMLLDSLACIGWRQAISGAPSQARHSKVQSQLGIFSDAIEHTNLPLKPPVLQPGLHVSTLGIGAETGYLNKLSAPSVTKGRPGPSSAKAPKHADMTGLEVMVMIGVCAMECQPSICSQWPR